MLRHSKEHHFDGTLDRAMHSLVEVKDVLSLEAIISDTSELTRAQVADGTKAMKKRNSTGNASSSTNVGRVVSPNPTSL